jgi:hypothetical protein
MQPEGVISTPALDIPHYFNNVVHFFVSHGPDFYSALKSLIALIVTISIPLSIFLIIAIIMLVEGLKTIRRKEEVKYNAPAEPAYVEEKVDPELGRRWKQIMEHADSPNPNDWKQAIIDADVMLDNLVTRLGYMGETLGEKLKRSTSGDFKTRDAAWDAHMVRNRIAHDGAAYEINQLEAKRVIGLYRQVFDEFYHISG